MTQGVISLREQGVDQPGVEVKPARVDRSVAVGNDARPGDREPVMRDAEVLQQVEIGLITVVMIAGDLGRVAVLDLAGQRGEPVPDRFSFAVCRAAPSIWAAAVAAPQTNRRGIDTLP